MKYLWTSILTLSFASTVYADSVDALTTMSSEHLRTLSRNAASDSADSAYYNPAGTVDLKEGIHVNLSNQSYWSTWNVESESTGDDYKGDATSLFIPNLHVVYSKEKWSLYGGFNIIGGGGSVKFDDGVPIYEALVYALTGEADTFDEGYVNAQLVHQAFSLGAAYKVNQSLSFAFGIRQVYFNGTYEGTAKSAGGTEFDLEAEKEGQGLGTIIGAQYKINEKMNFAFRYELETDITTKNDTKTNDFGEALESMEDGYKSKRDLPARLALGFSYQFSEQTEVSLSYDKHFIQEADDCDDDDDAGTTCSYDDDYTDGYELGVGVQMSVNEKILVSGGILKAVVGGNDETYGDLEFAADHLVVGVGARYTISEATNLDFALSQTTFNKVENKDSENVYDKGSALGIAIGANFMF